METKLNLNSDKDNGIEWIQTVLSGSEPTNITNLNDDCKEHIFKYLEWNDLLSVLDSSKLLCDAASIIFKKKYINAYVRLGKVPEKNQLVFIQAIL